MKQCAWCCKVLNIHTKIYETVGAIILPDATHGICHECKEKMQEELEKMTEKKRRAA